MKFVRIIIVLLLSITFPATLTLYAQKPEIPHGDLRAWAAQNLNWMKTQIVPNRVVPDPDPSRRRLLISYELLPEKFPYAYHRSAVYDNALAALVFTVVGDYENAAFTLHALARLLRPDGSLWFGYNTANDWPSESDHDSALIRAGAIGWVGYSLTFNLAHRPSCGPDGACERERAYFLQTSRRLAEYLISLQLNNPNDARDGLVRLGFGSISLSYKSDTKSVVENYASGPYHGISTENNISAWFFLRLLSKVSGENRWEKAADRIRQGLLRSGWNESLGQFIEGFDPNGTPDLIQALDCASWGSLFLMAAGETEKAVRAYTVAETRYASLDGASAGFRPYNDTPVYQDADVNKFFFPGSPGKNWQDLPLVWSEGTLGAALAYLRQGNREKARQIIEGLKPLQAKDSGLQYASRDVPFHMREAPGIASAAWLILVAEDLCGNPTAGDFWR